MGSDLVYLYMSKFSDHDFDCCIQIFAATGFIDKLQIFKKYYKLSHTRFQFMALNGNYIMCAYREI